MSTEDKPRFPEPAPTLELKGGITATLMHDFDKYSSGHMMMTVTDATITEHDTGKEIGHVMCSITGTHVGIDFGRRQYSISLKDLFQAVYEAENEVVNA